MPHGIQPIPSSGASIAYDPDGHTVIGRTLLRPFTPGGVFIPSAATNEILTNSLGGYTPFLQMLRLVATAAPAGAAELTLKSKPVTLPDGATASIFAKTVLFTEAALGSFNAGMVGQTIVITGAGANNGSFVITEFISDTAILYENNSATIPGAPAGGILWAIGVDTGATASIGALTMRITGLTGIDASFIGRSITITGAATVGNNGTFTISEVLSSTEVAYLNPAGVAPDASNGAISWTIDRILLKIPVVAAYAAGHVLEYQFPTPLRGFPGEPLAVDTPAGSGTWLWLPNGFFMTEDVL